MTGTLTNAGTIQMDAGSGTSQINGGTLDTSGAVVDNGTFTTSSTWSSTGPVTVASTGSFTDGGTFTNAAGGSIANGGTFEVGVNDHFTENGGTTTGSPVLVNDAFLNLTGGGASSFSVLADGTSNVTGAPYAGQTLTLQTNSSADIAPGSTPNLGAIELSGGATLSLTGTLTSAGTIQMDAGSGTSVINGGTIDTSGAVVDNGTFTTSSTWSSTGPVTVASTGSFTDGGTFTNAAGGSIANGGTFEVGVNDHFTENGGTTTGSPVLVNDAFLNFSGGGASSFSVIANGTSNVTGTPFFAQTLTLQTNASLSINPGTNSGTIELEPGSHLSVTGTLTNAGTIQMDAGSGTSQINGGTLDTSGAVVDNGTFTTSSTWSSTGPVTVASTGSFTDGGTFTNAAGGSIANGGTFEVGVNDHFTENGGTTTGSPVLVNDAFLNLTGGGASSFSVLADGTSNVTGAPYAGQTLTLQTNASADIAPGSTPNLGTIELSGEPPFRSPAP